MKMQQFSRIMTWTVLVVGALLLAVTTLEAAPSPSLHPGYYSDIADDESQYEIIQMLARLGQNMIREDLENSKRGLDLGLSRGFSGSQAAKHLMGLHAATYAGGPGRRRRSDEDK